MLYFLKGSDNLKDCWYTWHDEKFSCDEYLYHYTTIEKACKILYYQSLRFSPVSNTNDTTESKVKLEFENNGNIEDFLRKKESIRKYMLSNNDFLQLLCFSMDENKSDEKKVYTKSNDMYFVDMAGRGFALPRMWAQYADNNSGVCLIINKRKFEDELNNNYNFLKVKYDKVEYKDTFDVFRMNSETIESLANSISEDETVINGYTFLDRNKEYVDYSFFTKGIDWINEKEFRYLISCQNKKNREVKKLYKYLDGVVVGEKIDSVCKWEIESLVQKLNDKNYNPTEREEEIVVKKISFEYNCSRLI